MPLTTMPARKGSSPSRQYRGSDVGSVPSMRRIDGLRALELGLPGEMREQLIGLVLAGRKTATAGLLSIDYQAQDEAVEQVGEQLILLDTHGATVARVEVTGVEITTFDAVTWQFADAEGEGFTSIEDWRAGHRWFWSAVGAQVDDSTMVVCLRFRLI